MKTTMTWIRIRYDGIYQFIAENENENTVIESKIDVTDGKCRELWEEIKKSHPNANGYKSFCEAYREAKKEFDEYAERDQRRYDNFWGNRK